MVMANGGYGDVVVRMLEARAASSTDLCVRETFHADNGNTVEVECWGPNDWNVFTYLPGETVAHVIWEEIGDDDVPTALEEGGV